LVPTEGEQVPRMRADVGEIELRLLSDHGNTHLAARTRPINRIRGQTVQR
jgi:hypothetical protein